MAILAPLSLAPSTMRALYPLKEVQHIIAVSHAQVYRLIAAGRLDARKIGARTFITAISLQQFITDLPRPGEAA